MMDLTKMKEAISLESMMPDKGTQKVIETLSKYGSLIPEGMTEFQVKNFVVGSELSSKGRLRKCLIESRNRVESMESLLIEKKLREIELQEIQKEYEGSHGTQKDKGILLCIKKEREIKSIDRSLNSNWRELMIFADTIEELESSLIDNSEEEEWEIKFTHQLGLDLLTSNTISSGLADAILKMPEGSQIKTWLENKLILLNKQINNEG